MGIEEQKEEREVLDSIFPDEITDISDNSYRVSITLDVPNPNFEEDVDPPVILLNVTYPESYPDVGPHLDITTPLNAAKHPYIDVSADKAQLLDALGPTIEDSLGMAMVFTLVTTLKDSAEILISDRMRQEEEIKEVAARQKEEEENRRFHGTVVTRERFLEWRDKFRKEMQEKEKQQREEEEAEEKKKKGVKMEEKKLTGRQLWERGLVGKGEEEDIDGEDAIPALESLKVSG
ncbi:hypothetical protein PV10_08572 [Exophiala mesophila]|uniref:RWD domain-containing protein n=1 Tax=Exophiala mesophila TaxID=212818 RepID=A0A0D1XL94_EXOME|nr:uncharacterized protein PV10_08572 [Exophiala mesophila]KIV88946.1 hypothetical protein PV10_08572 [Exophiala mesophila]